MRNKSLHFITLIAVLALSIPAFPQSAIDDFTYEIEAIPIDMGMPGLDTLYTLKCIILVSEPDSISTIYIQAGTEESTYDVYDFTFLNNQSQQLPDGTAFLKRGNKFYIILGDSFDFHYYYEVKLEDVLGNISEPLLINL